MGWRITIKNMNNNSEPFHFILPNGLCIGPTCSKEIIEKYSKNIRDMNTGYVWYDIPEQELDGETFVVSLCLHEAILESYTVTLTDDKYGISWDDWTEDKEKQRAKDTGRFLKKIGCSPGKYTWGEVWASFDSKSGQGNGGVRYKKDKMKLNS